VTGPEFQLLFDRAGRRPPGSPLDDDALVELYRYPEEDRRRLRTNFVASLDGSVQGPDGRSGGLGTPSDQHVFALHRALADAVVVGAGTVRQEGYRAVDLQPWQRELRERHGLAPLPTLVVLSGSARLEPSIARPAEGAGGPVVVVTTGGKAPGELDVLRDAGVEVLEQEAALDLGAALTTLEERGQRRLLCEGGPGLHRDLLAAGLVDELSLTLAPVVVAGTGMRSTRGAGLDLPLACELAFAVLAGDGTLFTSYRVRGPGWTSPDGLSGAS
jgi:riboflavin biosynthesis pyrimidine reductase